jgi:hypothetical protein
MLSELPELSSYSNNMDKGQTALEQGDNINDKSKENTVYEIQN